MRRRASVVLALLLVGCGTSGTELADLRGQLTLKLSVADRASGVAPTDFFVLLPGPDMTAVSSSELHCPVLDATVLVNGVKLTQFDRGGEKQSWLGVDDGDDPCDPPQFGLSFSALPTAWRAPVTQIRVSDDSAEFVADLENLFVGPVLAFPPETAPELHPGATVTLSITPSQPAIVGEYLLSLAFVPDDPAKAAAAFNVSNVGGALSFDDHSVTFVVPAVEPAPGTLLLSAQTLGPRLLGCSGFAACNLPEAESAYAFYSSAPLVAAVVP